MVKKIALLGATGSIGMQTLDVVSQHPEEFEIVSIACGKNMPTLFKILDTYPVKNVSVASYEDHLMVKEKYPHHYVCYGDDGILEMINTSCDLVVNALVGFVGLKPSLYAIEKRKILALANKESLVIGGELMKQALARYDGKMYPIDSEHSAIFQSLEGNQVEDVKRIILTASGGSLRHLKREELMDVSVEQALAHPNWSMGARITIDSATMLNKGFEVIEAYYLFSVPMHKISVIIHPESIVHSMVEYKDRAIIAQLGSADMRIPIQYALTYPHRLHLGNSKALDFGALKSLNFEDIDFKRYPLLALAFDVLHRKGNAGAIINAADEAAIDLFLQKKITFLEIEDAICSAFKNVAFMKNPSLRDLIKTDRETRAYIYNEWYPEHYK
ncbi:MAG: 1-deoxy-D-xylulose-5-phosphate reductoisomerase [Breznakia sp.]